MDNQAKCPKCSQTVRVNTSTGKLYYHMKALPSYQKCPGSGKKVK